MDTKDYSDLELRIAASFICAAAGDAMGGPVECQHAARIKRFYGRVDMLLPYRTPPGLMPLHPGYAVHDAPGSVTDDTFIRLDFCRFFAETTPPWKASSLADWMLQNANTQFWWPPARQALENVSRGKHSAEENGLHHPQGGGNGWWTPIGLLYAGDPEAAASTCMTLATIWKSPLELQLNASIQAGLAYALTEGADAAGIIETMLSVCGPLASALLERARKIGEQSTSFDELVSGIYQNLLVREEIRAADGPFPDNLAPLDYTDDKYTSSMLAEQVPIEVASLAFSNGGMDSISNTVCIGRDCDSTATTVGSWVGALHGLDAVPALWIDQIQEANINEFNLLDEIDRLIKTRRRLIAE